MTDTFIFQDLAAMCDDHWTLWKSHMKQGGKPQAATALQNVFLAMIVDQFGPAGAARLLHGLANDSALLNEVAALVGTDPEKASEPDTVLTP